MAQPVTSSPTWKKPSDVMKIRLKGSRKRRSASVSQSQSNIQAPSSTGNTRGHRAGETRAGKRRNPFGQSAADRVKKRAHSEVSAREIEGATDHGLFEALEAGNVEEVFQGSTVTDQNKPDVQNRLKPDSDSANNPMQNGSDLTTESDHDSHSSPQITWKNTCPLDWCLKTRVRFISDSPFTWCGTLKTNEEAAGLSWFVRGKHHQEHGLPADRTKHGTASVESNWRSRFHQSTMVWMHPSLPWVKLYPRIHAETKTVRSSFVANDEKLQNTLMSNWCESFRSIFHQLRAGHCPYFYVCGYQSTVLFRAAGVSGFKQVHALWSPTTKGLRETLKTEGIDFTMPLSPVAKTGSGSPEQGDVNTDSAVERSVPIKADMKHEENAEEDDEEEYNQDDDAASSWLQSMGLDKQSFPSLDPRRIKFQRDESLKLDKRPQSLVLVSGSSVQGLYNFLLNSDIMIAPTGSQAGIPPTLIAPAAFEGATIIPYKFKSGKLQQAVGNGIQEFYSLDVTGPLLPSNVHAITQLLTTTQERGYTANLYNHDPTMIFSSVFADNLICTADRHCKLINCDLSPELLLYLTQGEDPEEHTTIRELVSKEGRYSWTPYTPV